MNIKADKKDNSGNNDANWVTDSDTKTGNVKMIDKQEGPENTLKISHTLSPLHLRPPYMTI